MASFRTNPWQIFVAGASGLLGTHVIFALLSAGAEVTALVPPGAALPPDLLAFAGGAEGRVRVVEGDAWNPGALVGRSRGHGALIHLVGSLIQQPDRGLTYDYLNVTSLHNVARMAARDGVPHLIYLSAARAPWLPGGYIASKRRAEAYLRRSGLAWTILRAPLVYPRGYLQNPLLAASAALSSLPLPGWPVRRWGPLPVDVVARAIARLALTSAPRGRLLYSGDLRRLARQSRRLAASAPPSWPDSRLLFGEGG